MKINKVFSYFLIYLFRNLILTIYFNKFSL